MNVGEKRPDACLMIAYTYYQSDPRVIREAEAAVAAGMEVDFLRCVVSGTLRFKFCGVSLCIIFYSHVIEAETASST